MKFYRLLACWLILMLNFFLITGGPVLASNDYVPSVQAVKLVGNGNTYTDLFDGSTIPTENAIIYLYVYNVDFSSINNQNITLLDNGGHQIEGIEFPPYADYANILINLPQLIPGMTYSLHVSNLKTTSGDVMQSPYSINLRAVMPKPKDHRSQMDLLSAGAFHSLWVTAAGELEAWGDNSHGQLGNGTTVMSPVPVFPKVPSHPLRPLAVSAGEEHSLVLTSDQQVLAWGGNESGQLGIGTNQDGLTPVQVPGIQDAVALAAGKDFSLVLRNDGTIWSFGENYAGQLGDGTNEDKNVPVQVKGLNGIVAIAAGGKHALAIKADKTVWAWGDNTQGQLGDGTTTNHLDPVQVAQLNDVTAISAGWGHSIALTSDGNIFSWGDNRHGQLGNGKSMGYITVPEPVQGIQGVRWVFAGYNQSFAIGGPNTTYGWGDNLVNQINDSSNRLITTPTLLNFLASTISVGAGHTLANGQYQGSFDSYGWGYNEYGQVGNGLTVHIHEPSPLIQIILPLYYRLAGQTQIETAVAISEVGWNYGALSAVVVNESAYADALPGSVLAAAVNAPILLTSAKTLSTSTSNELERLSPKTVFILGGTAVVSTDIEQQLKDKFKNVIRIDGYDQYETAAKIADYLKKNNLVTPGKAVIAYGENFPDALAVSPLAAHQHIPILLTRTQSLPTYTQNAIYDLQVTETTIVGGSAVISSEVAAQLPGVRRFWGSDKYDTAVAVAKGMNPSLTTVFVATGENFPDALAGSVLAARTNSPILLVNKDLPYAPADFVSVNHQNIHEVIALGGQAVVPDIVLNKINAKFPYNL